MNTPSIKKMSTAQKIVTAILLIFGLLTLFMSSSVIFDLFGIREKEGNYVLFIVWANFIASLLYLVSAWGFIKRYNWTTHILGVATLLLIVSFVTLLNYIKQGGVHETKTVFAIAFRITITLAFTYFSWKFNKKKYPL